MNNKIKRVVASVLVAVMLLGSAPLSGMNFDFVTKAFALDEIGDCEDNLTYTFDESSGLLTISGTGSMNCSFYGDKSIKTVVIEKGVTSIGENAFCECTGLTSVIIPDSVISIGEYAFQGCTELTSITIPDSVTDIGEGAFNYCMKLKEISIGKSVESIGDYGFAGCVRLTEITLPDSLQTIGKAAFALSALKKIYIPKNVESFGMQAFWCYNYTDDDIKDLLNYELDYTKCESSIISISVDKANKTFDSREDCNAIVETETNTIVLGCKNTKIPNSITNIGNLAFAYCNNLTNIKIPKSVTEIGYGAFLACAGLTSITIPDSVKKLNDFTFSYCENLKNVYLGKNCTEIGYGAFSECNNNVNICVSADTISLEERAFEKANPLFIVKDGSSAYQTLSDLNYKTIRYSVEQTYLDKPVLSFFEDFESDEEIDYSFVSKLILENPEVKYVYFEKVDFNDLLSEEIVYDVTDENFCREKSYFSIEREDTDADGIPEKVKLSDPKEEQTIFEIIKDFFVNLFSNFEDGFFKNLVNKIMSFWSK